MTKVLLIALYGAQSYPTGGWVKPTTSLQTRVRLCQAEGSGFRRSVLRQRSVAMDLLGVLRVKKADVQVLGQHCSSCHLWDDKEIVPPFPPPHPCTVEFLLKWRTSGGNDACRMTSSVCRRTWSVSVSPLRRGDAQVKSQPWENPEKWHYECLVARGA